MATRCAVFEAGVPAVLRLPTRLEFDSSRRMLHIGQTDDTACRSRSISLAQPASATGSELPPVWFVLVKHGALAELVRLVVALAAAGTAAISVKRRSAPATTAAYRWRNLIIGNAPPTLARDGTDPGRP